MSSPLPTLTIRELLCPWLSPAFTEAGLLLEKRFREEGYISSSTSGIKEATRKAPYSEGYEQAFFVEDEATSHRFDVTLSAWVVKKPFGATLEIIATARSDYVAEPTLLEAPVTPFPVFSLKKLLTTIALDLDNLENSAKNAICHSVRGAAFESFLNSLSDLLKP